MKKIIIILISIILGVCFIFGILYAIDMSRMNNNEPVVFSTWGYDYAPPAVEKLNIGDITGNENTENKNSETKHAIYNQSGEYLDIELPNEWEYQIITEPSEQYEYGIKFYLANDTEKYAVLYSYKNIFGVCGTGLETKDLVSNDGISINVGYYGDDWSFMTYDYDGKEIVAVNHGLKEIPAEQAIEILKTLKYTYSDFELSVVESEKTEKKLILNINEIHEYNPKFNLYYYGIDEVNVKINNNEMTLEKALKDGYLTLDGIITKAYKDVRKVEEIYAKMEEYQSSPLILPRANTYRDGGTTEYIYENYTIIKCNTVDGNMDMYICKAGTKLKDLSI